MKSLFKALVISQVLMGWVGVQAGVYDTVSKPAGITRMVAVPGNSLHAVSLQPFSGSLDALLAGQLNGGLSAAQADKILKWDPVTQAYVGAFKADGTGDPAKDDQWFSDVGTWQKSTLTIAPGEGFWIINRSNVAQTVYVGGEVIGDATRSVVLAPGLNLFSYPFSSRIALNSTQMAKNGAYADRKSSLSDTVNDPDPGGTQWLKRSGKSSSSYVWCEQSGATSSKVLTLAEGYWYQRRLRTSLTWKEARPYAYPFGVFAGAPQIVNVQGGPDGAVLTIGTAAFPNGSVDIYYQDVLADGAVDPVKGWSTAVLGLPVQNAAVVTWTDAGSVTRPAVAQVYTRLYLAARGDVDTDGDGLADARETLVTGTNPTLADTDGDGYTDGWEVENGMNPLIKDVAPSSKIKGMRVSLGYCYGGPYSGMNADAIADLIVRTSASWGCNTLYVKAFTGPYGTYWANPTTPYLAQEGGLGSQDVLRKLVNRAHVSGVKVYAWVELNRAKTAWTSNPGWREKAADGTDFSPGEYLISVYNPEVVAWTKSVVGEILDLGVDGIDMAESDLGVWGTGATYDQAANDRYRAAYPAGTLGDANWVAFRKRVVTDWHGEIGKLTHARGKQFHVTYMWNGYADGTLWPESYLADRVGFSFNGLLELPVEARPDCLIGELMWQSQEARYAAGTFTADWTKSATAQFVNFVAGRARAVAHVEASTAVGTVTVVPGPADIETSLALGLQGSDGADIYDHDLVYRSLYTVNGVTAAWGATAVSNVFNAVSMP
jgi:hypothetical protein